MYNKQQKQQELQQTITMFTTFLNEGLMNLNKQELKTSVEKLNFAGGILNTVISLIENLNEKEEPTEPTEQIKSTEEPTEPTEPTEQENKDK